MELSLYEKLYQIELFCQVYFLVYFSTFTIIQLIKNNLL